MATSIKAQYGTRLWGIIRSGMCSDAPLDDEIDFIEAKCWRMNEEVYVGIYIKNLDKDEVKVLII